MNGEQRSLNYFIAKSDEELLKHAAIELIPTDAELHGKFHRDKKDVKNGEPSRQWLRYGDLNREAESLLVATTYCSYTISTYWTRNLLRTQLYRDIYFEYSSGHLGEERCQ